MDAKTRLALRTAIEALEKIAAPERSSYYKIVDAQIEIAQEALKEIKQWQ